MYILKNTTKDKLITGYDSLKEAQEDKSWLSDRFPENDYKIYIRQTKLIDTPMEDL